MKNLAARPQGIIKIQKNLFAIIPTPHSSRNPEKNKRPDPASSAE